MSSTYTQVNTVTQLRQAHISSNECLFKTQMRSLRLELIVYMSGNLLLLFYLELQQCYWSIDLIVGYLLVRHDSRESSDSNLDSCFWRCWNMHWALCLGTTCYQDSWRGSNSNNTIKVCRKTRYSVTRAT